MRRLFLKIFLSVLLTTLFTFVIGLAIAIWLLPKPHMGPGPGSLRDSDEAMNEWRGKVCDVLAFHVQAAADMLATAGPATVLAHLDSLNAMWGVQTYLVDEACHDLSGRDLPPTACDLARRTLADGGLQRESTSETIGAALAVRSGDRPAYAIVARMPEMSPPPPSRFASFTLLRLAPVAIGLGLVCYFLARYITDPVLKLRAALRRFGDGDLEQRVGASVGRRRDELGELARDFDHMAERIATLLGAQRRLLQDISHELRSPLARQRVALELVRQQGGDDAVRALDRAEREAERLDELIGELLTLTRLESSTDGAAQVPVDLAALVREVIENAEFEACGGNRAVRLVTCAPCVAIGVPELLRRAVENVVRNALAYTADETEVAVSLDQDGDDAVIQVRDHGPGVPDTELADIFRPFYRVSRARDRQSGGVGLGLAIAARAIRFHGGAVLARNHPDGGLAVRIRLPRNTSRDTK